MLETGTHCNWNVHYPIWRKMDGMGCVQRCRRLQLGEFHVSDGLEIDSCNDLIFRQSDQTIAGITTRVDIFGRLKAEFLPFSSTKSFQHHSRLCSIRFFRHCSSQQLNTATVIIAATKNTSRCPAAGSSGTANTGPSVIFLYHSGTLSSGADSRVAGAVAAALPLNSFYKCELFWAWFEAVVAVGVTRLDIVKRSDRRRTLCCDR